MSNWFLSGMANGKMNAKIETALNRGITHQAENEWRKNSPVVKKFATPVFFNQK